jgi:4-carboxymuconolactone decarboxylase
LPTKRRNASRRSPAAAGKRRAAKDAPPRPRGADRMPPLPASALSPAQQAAAAELTAGPRGGVIGPFIAALRSPELMTHLQRLGRYLRYENVLGQRLTELAILVTARAWSQGVEWAIHAESAAAHGVAGGVIDAIAHGRRPARMAGDEKIVYDFLRELRTTQAVGDRTYARAVAELGEAGVVDLLGVAGYYTTLAMILNVARTPVPPGLGPPLPPLPRRKKRGRRAVRR